MKRIVVWFCVLVVALVAQTQNNDKVDVKTFLENIKKMFQETVEKMRKQQQNRMKRREDKKNKMKTKKMLINKLANPYVSFRRQHTVIDYKKRPDTQSSRNNLQEENSELDGKSEGISPQTVDKVLRANPVFNPFSFSIDRLRKLLSKIQRGTSNAKDNIQDSSATVGVADADPQTLRYEEELYDWFREVYSKIQLFWDMVYRLFIINEKRFEHLKNVVCVEEISDESRWQKVSPVSECKFFNLPKRFKVVRLTAPSCAIENPDNWTINSSVPALITTCREYLFIDDAILSEGRCTPLLYKKALLIGDIGSTKVKMKIGISPKYSVNKSLCYNLVALTFFAHKEIIRARGNDVRMVKPLISYMKFISKIYAEKILPIAGNMCYMKHLCDDIIGMAGLIQDKQQWSEEENIIFLLWNLQKDVYLPFIQSLRRLISFIDGLEKGEVKICDEMQDNFKRLINRNFVEEGKKISDIEVEVYRGEITGKVNISLYKELSELIKKVKDESIPIREALIRLWQFHINSATSIDDLKCVIGGFYTFIDNINVDNENILKLYLSNLISLVGEKIIEGLITNSVNQITTFEDILKAIEVIRVLKNTKYNFTNLEKSGNAKIKGLIRFVKIVDNPAPLYYSNERGDYSLVGLFDWLTTLDYSGYLLTTTFNLLRCITTSITPQMFINYLKDIGKIPKGEESFLECFIAGETLQKCKEIYGSIEYVLGKKIGIGNLYEAKEGLDNLQKFNKWGDIPNISSCCNGECANVPNTIKKWCEVLTSPTFDKCCKPPLAICTASSETFCLESEIEDCTTFYHSLARNGSRCYDIAEPISQMLTINYFSNNQEKKIFCDVRERYPSFCSDPITFIKNIKDDDNKNPVEQFFGALKCECGICGSAVPAYICSAGIPLSLTLGYRRRDKVEKFLKETGLLEEAKKAIKEGLLEKLGKCPF